jgi:Zn-dependent peptidase ImmA (M78 family)/transcriptional regulator with XRE-family HTH domain
MLVWGRESLQLTLESAAARIRVKPERLAAWEAGAERPSIPQLRRIAHAYGRSLPVFYMESPPVDWPIPRDLRRLPGERPLQLSPELIIGMRQAQYRRSILLELEPDTEPSNLVGLGKPGVAAEVLAARMRNALGVTLERQQLWKPGHDSLNGWKNALEDRGVLVFHFTGVPVTDVRGYSISEPTLPIVAVNGHDSVNGRIFTLAHELGHIGLGDGGSCDLGDATVPRASRPKVEVYCNAFAGALLVPEAALLADQAVQQSNRRSEWERGDLERLATRFRVSREVVLRRLLSLDRASSEFYRQHRAQMLALPPPDTRPSDPDSKGPAFATMVVRDVGKPFARAVVAAYRADEITGSDLSDFLGASVQHVPAIEARLGGRDVLTGGVP